MSIQFYTITKPENVNGRIIDVKTYIIDTYRLHLTYTPRPSDDAILLRKLGKILAEEVVIVLILAAFRLELEYGVIEKIGLLPR